MSQSRAFLLKKNGHRAIIKNILDIKKHVPGPFYRSKVQVDVHCLRNIKAFSLTEMFEAVLLIQYERINPWPAILVSMFHPAYSCIIDSLFTQTLILCFFVVTFETLCTKLNKLCLWTIYVLRGIMEQTVHTCILVLSYDPCCLFVQYWQLRYHSSHSLVYIIAAIYAFNYWRFLYLTHM